MHGVYGKRADHTNHPNIMNINLHPLTRALEEHAFLLSNNTHMLQEIHRELYELKELLRSQQTTTTQTTSNLIKPRNENGNDLPTGHTNSFGPR